jgi:hypothetical protein
MESKKNLYSVRYILKRDQIQSFVNDLHSMQFDFLEIAVSNKERQGFPEVVELLNAIKNK